MEGGIVAFVSGPSREKMVGGGPYGARRKMKLQPSAGQPLRRGGRGIQRQEAEEGAGFMDSYSWRTSPNPLSWAVATRRR